MKNNNVIITYRVNKAVNPDVVLSTIETLIEKYHISYQNFLWKLSCSIVEYYIGEEFRSNKNKNAILSICNKYPCLDSFFEQIKKDDSEGNVTEDFCIRNYADGTYYCNKNIDYSIISGIKKKDSETLCRQ